MSKHKQQFYQTNILGQPKRIKFYNKSKNNKKKEYLGPKKPIPLNASEEEVKGLVKDYLNYLRSATHQNLFDIDKVSINIFKSNNGSKENRFMLHYKENGLCYQDESKNFQHFSKLKEEPDSDEEFIQILELMEQLLKKANTGYDNSVVINIVVTSEGKLLININKNSGSFDATELVTSIGNLGNGVSDRIYAITSKDFQVKGEQAKKRATIMGDDLVTANYDGNKIQIPLSMASAYIPNPDFFQNVFMKEIIKDCLFAEGDNRQRTFIEVGSELSLVSLSIAEKHCSISKPEDVDKLKCFILCKDSSTLKSAFDLNRNLIENVHPICQIENSEDLDKVLKVFMDNDKLPKVVLVDAYSIISGKNQFQNVLLKSENIEKLVVCSGLDLGYYNRITSKRPLEMFLNRMMKTNFANANPFEVKKVSSYYTKGFQNYKHSFVLERKK